MACVQNILSGNADSEMEEGEIVDDLDDLSDISSEEEFLLRQRLQVLENYNNVLERKKTKSSISENDKQLCEDALSHDLSEISDGDINYPQAEPKKRHKPKTSNLNKHKKRKEENGLFKPKAVKKKPHRVKKKIAIKIISESSEESEDEYRNKRRKLANAVSLTKEKNDTSSLKARITKMLRGSQTAEKEEIKTDSLVDSLNWCIESLGNSKESDLKKSGFPNQELDLEAEICELIDLCGDDDSDKKVDVVPTVDCVDSPYAENQKDEENIHVREDSEEDLELLRQHALKTKVNKSFIQNNKPDPKQSKFSEDEDSDTAELRAICLKSALLKKAIELKRKQKLKKRLSQSFQDETMTLDSKLLINEVGAGNNTDIESVDMDIGSDGDERSKEAFIEQNAEIENNILVDQSNNCMTMTDSENHKEDDNEEDEDLLRAKLLTSLSKNLSNLVSPSVVNNTTESSKSNSLETKEVSKMVPIPEQKPFIIRLGGSDSEGESEATRNLTKMHMKWSEQNEFQQKLDIFLKSTRMEVENQALPKPKITSKPLQQNNSTPKFVAKNVKYLPKSEQIEYKNLVKRMEELEKLKEARQSSLIFNKSSNQIKDTLKPRNVTLNTIKNPSINDLEQQIAISRKKIAEESSKMLRLKEEGIKLSQKHKIVATELRNITTAITLNKKEQRLIHNKLSKIRHQHQLLLNRSPSLQYSINNSSLNHTNGKNIASTRLQKENNPGKEEYKNPEILKSVKVIVANDYKAEPARLSIEVDVTRNKKIVKVPQPTKDVNVKVPILKDDILQDSINSQPVVEAGGGTICDNAKDTNSQDIGIEPKDISDYKSPLEALQGDTWTEDPNTFLCPFEVGGACKDPDCKYLHPKVPPVQ